MSAAALQPVEHRIPLRPGRGAVVLHATGFRHPVGRGRSGERFTGYADLTHVQLGVRQLRIGTRHTVFSIERDAFADPEDAVRLARQLVERAAAAPGGAARLERMADAETLLRQPLGLRVTPIAAGLCLLVFVLQMAVGPAVTHVGLMSPLLVGAGEPWRLVTANFLHGNAIHLLFGVLGLLALGALVERPLGAVRTLLVLGVSGLLAMAAAWPAGYDVLVGASGMVAGLAGALLWLELRRCERLPAGWRVPRRLFIAALAVDAVLPLFVPVIAGAAHAAGFAAGAGAAAVATGPRLRREPLAPAARIAAVLVLAAATLAAISAGRFWTGWGAWEAHARHLLATRSSPPLLMNDAAWLIAIAREPSPAALDEALALAERAVRATDRRDPNLLDTLAEAQFRAGHVRAAVQTIEEAIELAPREDYFREQRRRFLGERPHDDRPPPPQEPWHAPPPVERFEPPEPGIPI